ncbi:DMT family transporter [Candidatus Sodalis pierantonius]|uniref:DMT family transporter n=1 Tax=Candidatus Sodalis pierantonii TaxID=1486991 RepID=UPI00046D6C22|nr:DMT family transporter [Candidatus Sodalis pierantonius]
MLNIALARQSRTAPQLADAMLLLVAVIWGSSYAATKQALAFYPVLGFIALRFTLTLLVLVPQLRGAGLTALRPGLPLGLILLGVFICETQGVAIISAGNAAFLISLFVIFTPLVEWLVCRGRLDGRLILAALLSLLGVYWLCGGSAQRPVPALALTAVQTGVVAAGSWLLLLFTFRQPPPLPASWQFWGITLYLALFATLFAFFAQNYAAGLCNVRSRLTCCVRGAGRHR